MPGLFTPPDMSTMYPQGAPSFQGNEMPMQRQQSVQDDMSVMQPEQLPMQSDMPQAGMPDGSFEAPLGQQGIPTYVGNPTLDKYIHMFLGAV